MPCPRGRRMPCISRNAQPRMNPIPAPCLRHRTHQPLAPQTAGTQRLGPAAVLFQPMLSAMTSRKNIAHAPGVSSPSVTPADHRAILAVSRRYPADIIAPFSDCPQQAWEPAGRAFRVNAQSFFRFRFPSGSLRKRREACDTRRLCARLVDSHVESNPNSRSRDHDCS